MANSRTMLVGDADGQKPARAAEPQAAKKGAPKRTEVAATPTQHKREAGDHVNRFLLCVLVSESSKRIKASAERAGESLPMTVIVRSVLRSYRRAAKDEYGPLAGTELDIPGIKILNEKILREEIARTSRDRVATSETRLARAERLGDDTRVRAEKDGLEHAIALRDQLPREIH